MTTAAELHTVCRDCGRKCTYVISAANVVHAMLRREEPCICGGAVRLAGYSGRRPGKRAPASANDNNGEAL